ncbi:MAG: hypothetical protein RLZZ502_1439, partial [Pseudomonadota bacterium]
TESGQMKTRQMKTRYVGSVLLLIAQLILTPIFGTLVLMSAPLPATWRFWICACWTRLMVLMAKWTCGIHYRVEGEEHVPKRPYIVASKHSSTWETVFLATYFQPASFVAKRELLWLPFFGWGFALGSPITINRKAGAQAMAQMVAQSEDRIKKGFVFVIFPEGTRIAAPLAGKYKTGCARLALGLAEDGHHIPILPVAHNAGYLWPKKPFWKKSGLITVRLMPPIYPQGHDASSLTSVIENTIENAQQDIGSP